MEIITLVGSLRRDSLNLGLAKALAAIGRDLATLTIHPLHDVPLFNQDIEVPPPAPVAAMRKAMADADGVLFVTPEYNRSVPAVMKNAIDWASRPRGSHCLAGKPVATAGASPGPVGTAVAQCHLRSVLTMIDCRVMGMPECFLGGAATIADEHGEVADERTRGYLRRFVEALAQWVARKGAGG